MQLLKLYKLIFKTFNMLLAYRNAFIAFTAIISFVLFITACRNKPGSSAAVEAKDALATFQVADGFKIELIASEPLVESCGYGNR